MLALKGTVDFTQPFDQLNAMVRHCKEYATFLHQSFFQILGRLRPKSWRWTLVRSTSLRPRFFSLDYASLSQQNQVAEERKALVTGLVRVAPIMKRRLGRLGLGDYQKSDIQIWQNFQVGKYIKHEVWLNRFPEGFRHLPGSSQLLASGHGTIWKVKLLFLLRSELGFFPTI